MISHVRGVMLEGISCAGKTSVLLALKRLLACDMESERSVIILGEHYSQIMHEVDGKRLFIDREAHANLLCERLNMLTQLTSWSTSLGAYRRRSRGLLVVFERFYLNHVAAFDDSGEMGIQMIEKTCLELKLKNVLLTIPQDKFVERLKYRDAQTGNICSSQDYEQKAVDCVEQQNKLLAAANASNIPLLQISTDSLMWDNYAIEIEKFIA